jgi:adenine-specific DNA methylase
MIPKDCKRLAEVDFPIAEVSRHAAQGSRQGHPSTLHLWWARRPCGLAHRWMASATYA